MKSQVWSIALVILVLIACLHAETTTSTTEDYIMDGKGQIDWECTAKCSKWWLCRITGFFLRKCRAPAGCDCSKFAFEP